MIAINLIRLRRLQFVILMLASILLMPVLAFAQPPDNTTAGLNDVVRLAEDAYAAGDYLLAVQLFEEAAALAPSSALRGVPPELYYNLASAYFETDDLGMALVYALRTQHEMPRDPELARMLALIRALRVDVLGDETAPIDMIAASTRGVMTRRELALMTFVLWAVFFALLLVRLMRPRTRQSRSWMIAVVVSGAVMSLALVLLFSRMYVDAGRPAAVVTAFTSHALSGPGEDYIRLFMLYNAAEGRVLDIQDEYVRLLLPDGRQGWIPAEDLTEL